VRPTEVNEILEGVVAWQGSLFSGVEDRADLTFEGLIRRALDDTSWVDVVPGWLHNHDDLFDLLLRDAPWQHRERWMYDQKVAEPRLVAVFDGPLPVRLDQIRAVLSEKYAVDFDSMLVNFYRDGRDSVAWHGDTVRRRLTEPLVATVSLGERRRFLLRRRGGGRLRWLCSQVRVTSSSWAGPASMTGSTQCRRFAAPAPG